jgi:hypothetical protein
MMPSNGRAVTPTRPQRLLVGVVVNVAALAAWAADASDQAREKRSRRQATRNGAGHAPPKMLY